MDLRHERAAKDDFFRRSADSPLSLEQRGTFSHLDYFAPDARFSFTVDLDPAGGGATEEVEMSNGTVSVLERAGVLRLRVDGADLSLVAYRQGEELFIPFRDATSGAETYGAGRYVEATPVGDARWSLDFNRAYNPYCAYNDRWRCPLPPRENWLTVAIRAGEKTFPH